MAFEMIVNNLISGFTVLCGLFLSRRPVSGIYTLGSRYTEITYGDITPYLEFTQGKVAYPSQGIVDNQTRKLSCAVHCTQHVQCRFFYPHEDACVILAYGEAIGVVSSFSLEFSDTIYNKQGDVCLEASCYIFHELWRYWTEAVDYCERQGGYLADVHSHIENQIIINISRAMRRHLWLGGTKTDEGTWVWIHDGRDVDYDGWYPTEPNDVFGNERCIQFWWDGLSWNDNNCNRYETFVCKMYSK